MKLIVVRSAGALLCGLLVLGCAPQERAPAAAPAPPLPPPAQVVVPAMTERQAAPPAYAPPPPTETPPAPPQPGDNVPPPTFGATEAQPPEPTVPNARSRTTQAVALATQQIDRLQRMQSTSSGPRRDDIGAALGDLQSKREKVLADLREVELQPPTAASTMAQQLDRDLTDLQGSVKSSYAIAPPPGEGLPEPAPLPPSQLP